MPPHNLLHALQYLQDVLQQRMAYHFSKEKPSEPFRILPLTLPRNDGTPFTRFIQQTQLKTEELIVLPLLVWIFKSITFFCQSPDWRK